MGSSSNEREHIAGIRQEQLEELFTTGVMLRQVINSHPEGLQAKVNDETIMIDDTLIEGLIIVISGMKSEIIEAVGDIDGAERIERASQGALIRLRRFGVDL